MATKKKSSESLKATTYVCYEIEVPLMPTSVEQSVNGPFVRVETFQERDAADRYFDSLLAASGDTYLVHQRHNIVMRAVSTTVLRQGQARYEA